MTDEVDEADDTGGTGNRRYRDCRGGRRQRDRKTEETNETDDADDTATGQADDRETGEATLCGLVRGAKHEAEGTRNAPPDALLTSRSAVPRVAPTHGGHGRARGLPCGSVSSTLPLTRVAR